MPSCNGKPRRRRGNWSKSFYSSATSPAPLPPDSDKQQQQVEEKSDGVDAQGKSPELKTLFRMFWKVAAPYWTSDDKVQARLQLAGVFALTLVTTAINVGFNFLVKDFYNALANKNQEQFTRQLLYYLGGFAGGIPGLVTLNFLQEKKEADFRYGLVRVRENAESIAFYGGEKSEMQLLLQHFRSAFENLTQLLISSRNLEFFTNGYRRVVRMLPAAVVAPMYLSGKIEFGVINQSVSAFNHILGDVSLIVYQFQAISAFSAVINRLGEFDEVLDRSSSKSLSDTSEDIHIAYKDFRSSSVIESNGSTPPENNEILLEIENLTLKTPSESTLIKGLSLMIKEKDNLLVMGPSGSGKTSLLRAMAGLWKTGTGKIMYYVKDREDPEQAICSDVNTAHDTFKEHGKLISRKSRIFFLPQRPYMVLGTLRQQLLYPTWADDIVPISDSTKPRNMLPFLANLANLPNSDSVEGKPMKPTTDELIKVLQDVRLGYLLGRFSLDSTHEWSSVLSLGEQQRLAFARLLLSQPQLVLLDESTSALDEANEVYLYQKIGAAGITYISIGHRSTLCDYHNRILRISTLDSNNEQVKWCTEPNRRETSLEFTNL